MTSGSVPLQFPGQKSFYRGKVREVYELEEDYIVMVASNRISAFDHILPREIPYKGQVLNQLAAFFLRATSDIVPNWLRAVPLPHVSVGKACTPIRVEMVIRGYLAGSAWRQYRDGAREICGNVLPESLQQSQKLAHPIITPAIKSGEGHDVDISKEELLKTDLITESDYAVIEKYTYDLFERGTQMAEERGLILVDTKYEFGHFKDEILLIDEVHTPDSSRYFIKEDYEINMAQGKPPQQLSKEFVREFLMEHGFQGRDGEMMPLMPDTFVNEISKRYIELYEILTGESFIPVEIPPAETVISKTLAAIREAH